MVRPAVEYLRDLEDLRTALSNTLRRVTLTGDAEKMPSGAGSSNRDRWRP